MKEITVIYKEFEKFNQVQLIRKQTGWQLSPRLVMEVDNEGPFFATYSHDITSDTVLASDATATLAITIPGDIGKLLTTLDGSEVASLTVADLGLMFAQLDIK